MRNALFIIGLLTTILFTSCSPNLRPFTQDLYEEFDWTQDELQQIQFYLSEDIVLHRNAGGDASTIKNGKIRLVNGREVEEVIFKKGTPGILLFIPKTNRFAISFDDSGNDKYLMFGPNKKANGKYVLLAKDWKKRVGKVTYNGVTYTTSTESAYASLLVDIKKARKIHYKSKTVEGRRIES